MNEKGIIKIILPEKFQQEVDASLAIKENKDLKEGLEREEKRQKEEKETQKGLSEQKLTGIVLSKNINRDGRIMISNNIQRENNSESLKTRVEKTKPFFQQNAGEDSNIGKEVKIYLPGEYPSDGKVIKPTLEQISVIYNGYENVNSQTRETLRITADDFKSESEGTIRNILDNFLRFLGNKYSIKNFISFRTLDNFSSEDVSVANAVKNTLFQMSDEQYRRVVDDILEFAEFFSEQLNTNLKFNEEFFKIIFLFKKLGFVIHSKEKIKGNAKLLELMIDTFLNGKESSLSTLHIQSFIKSNIKQLLPKDASLILNKLFDNNDLNNDLVTLLKSNFPTEWNNLINSEKFKSKEESLRKITELPLENLLRSPNIYGQQLRGYVFPEYQAKSRIGLEFEFLKTGLQNDFQNEEKQLQEIIENSPFKGGRLHMDQDQTECTFPVKGSEYNEKIFQDLAEFGARMEENPYFIRYGSLHLNVTKEGKLDEAVFLFNPEKNNRGRFETRYIMGPLLDFRTPYLLNFNITKQQFQIIDSLYHSYNLSDIRNFIQSKKEELMKLKPEQLLTKFNEIELEFLLSLSEKKNDKDLIALILIGYYKNTLPVTQISRMLWQDIIKEQIIHNPYKADFFYSKELAHFLINSKYSHNIRGSIVNAIAEIKNIEGDLENLKAIGKIARIDWLIALNLAKKIESIEGNLGNLNLISEIVEISLRLALSLVEKIKNIEGNSKNLKLISEFVKIDWMIFLKLAEKIENIEGDLENLKLISEFVKINWKVALELAKKIKNIPEKVLEEIENDKSIKLNDKLIMLGLCEENYNIEGNPENLKMIGEIAKINWKIALELVKKIKNIEGNLENLKAIDKIIEIDLDIVLELIVKIKSIENIEDNINIINQMPKFVIAILRKKIK